MTTTPDPAAVERERVVRLFLDLAADFEAARSDVPRPGVRDAARLAAYEEVAREVRTLAGELGVSA